MFSERHYFSPIDLSAAEKKPQSLSIDVMYPTILAGKSAIWVFRGYGAFEKGTGLEFYKTFPVFRKVYDETDQIISDLGYNFSIAQISFEDREGLLNNFIHRQLAIDTSNIAYYKLLEYLQAENFVQPGQVAGFSLGEVTAYEIAGAIDRPEKVRLLIARSQALEEAPKGGKAAIRIKGENPTQEQIAAYNEIRAFAHAPEQGLVDCTYNADYWCSVGGKDAGLEKLLLKADEFRKKGIQIVRLPVRRAYHSPFVGSAVPGTIEALNNANMKDPDIPVLSNRIPGKILKTAQDIRNEIPEQLVNPVDWNGVDKYCFKQELHITEIGDAAMIVSFAQRRRAKVPQKVIAKVNNKDIVIALHLRAA